ncbi:7763_t:CDS:10 [Entrophospora sp. SA101]|nr:7763_t:CDS:10 [Entrophospora sp. SA101]
MSKSNNSPKGGVVVIRFNAKWIAHAHTIIAYVAFFSALILACWTHYYQIVKNEYWGYPEEWFPSVSAVTGDWYPARSIFQILIAIASGPRFLLIYLFYIITNKSDSLYPKIHAIIGLIRTISCGGWVYITSTDDHDIHDVAMIVYLVTTLPWMVGSLLIGPQSNGEIKWRKIFSFSFFGSLVPMIYYFIEHKVNRVAGAYTTYAFLEWSLIIYDIAFDAITFLDFNFFELQIINANLQQEVFFSSDEIVFKVDSWSNARGFIADTYLAFIYWSMLTSLGLTIWYFPLWHMGISGYEAFLLVTTTPGLLGFTSIRSIVASNHGVFHLLSLCGVASYLFTDPTQRLLVTSFGVAITSITWSSIWIESRNSASLLERNSLTWCLGLIMSNVVKMAWRTNNPIWPIMHKENGGWNGLGLILGVIASLEVMSRNKKNRVVDSKQKSKSSLAWISSAIGFGSLLFALHSLLTDTSTITRWVYNGYPNTGPLPMPWGAVIIVAMSLGLVLSPYRKIIIGIPWYIIGCVSCACLYYYPAWSGFFGGLLLSIYLMSLVPTFIVAYAFVPAGEYLREHTDYILLAMMIFIGVGLWNSSGNFKFKHLQLHKIHFNTRVGLAIMIVSAFITTYSRIPLDAPKPYHPEHKIVTAGIWTIHFALDNEMWASEYRIRDIIKELEMDIIGLLESDLSRIITGNRDFTQFLSEELNMYADYGPGPSKHTWGCAMLSKFPIIRSKHLLLPSPVGELACGIYATLDIYGQEIDVIVSHNGQEEDELDRKLQTTELAKIMKESKNPLLFLGYVVTTPHQGNYHILIDEGNVKDIDPTDHDRWCEYIAYRGVKRLGYARVSHGGITDTEIQLGKFQVLDKYDSVNWGTNDTSINESDVPHDSRFPPIFKGAGVRGHRYHVFNEPRYFN